MTDVAHSVNLDYPHDPIFQPQYLPATFATTTTQPLLNLNSASFGSYELTGEQSEVAIPFQSASIFDIQNWSLIAAMAFPQLCQLSDQDLTNSPQSHTSSPQQSNDMTAATAFTGQQYSDVDASTQQNPMLQNTPPFVEPSINYPCYPTTSTPSTTNSSNTVVISDNPPVTNNYSSRNVYIGSYNQQQQYLEHNNYTCPTTHPSRVGMINYPNNCLRQRLIYQGPSPTCSSSIGRQHHNHQKQISGTIGSNVSNISNVSYSRTDNVTSASLPSSIASNLLTYNNTSTVLVPSLYDHHHPSTIFATKPVPQTTITIPNSTGSSVSSSENVTPTKPYSYSGPPKSYYSRLPLYDRPFKCDTCPQSFNRNHDLKRHKRIHLAVKPYPCPYCDKQFSRKDALKRHILVKGCNNPTNNKRSTSPNSTTTNKSVDDSSSGQKYDSSIKSENLIKCEPTSDNGVHNNYI
jgi:uncharacterized Zn-finger protein